MAGNLNHLPHGYIPDWSNLKMFADIIFTQAELMLVVFECVETLLEREKMLVYKHESPQEIHSRSTKCLRMNLNLCGKDPRIL